MKDEDRTSRLAGMAFGEALERLASTDPREAKAVAAAETTASMKDGAIERLIAAFEEAAQVDDQGVEFWTARSVQGLLGYSDYRNFLNTVEKAKIACENSGQKAGDHFVDVTDMIEVGKGAEREIDDIRMTRYACYLTAQNGDTRKKPVAFAQTYFAIQTRRQEVQDDVSAQYAPLPEDQKRILLREEIKDHNKKLASAAKGAGVVEPFDFAVFQTFGYKGLYGGLDVPGIRRVKGLNKGRNILDHMGSTELAANLFRATQTEEKLRKENIKGKELANATHHEVGRKVRQAIKDIGGTMPEHLPPAEDIVKVGKRLRNAIASTQSKDRKS
jgi:DNA-damage-inducible protein D